MSTLCLALAVLPRAAEAQQPSLSIAGRIVDGDRLPIAGAVVRLVGVTATESDGTGYFRFDNVAAGPVQLSVSALGYQDYETRFVLGRDTALLIQLTASAIPLDPLEAATRRVTIRGRVTDAESRLGARATVYLRPGSASSEADRTGRYRISNAPAGPGSRVIVESFGYLPQVVELLSDRDTVIDFRLEPDPVAQAMLAYQVGRVRSRSDTMYLLAQTIPRGSTFMSGTVDEVLRYHYRVQSSPCVIIDDVPMQRQALQLNFIPAHEVQLIEIFDRHPTRPAAGMVRIYTRAFLADMLNRRADIGEINYYRGIRPMLCR